MTRSAEGANKVAWIASCHWKGPLAHAKKARQARVSGEKWKKMFVRAADRYLGECQAWDPQQDWRRRCTQPCQLASESARVTMVLL